MTLVGRIGRALANKNITRDTSILSRQPTRWQCAVRSRHGGTATRTWSTPLAKTLAEAVQTTGPISIAQYMRQCLTSPEGYYASQTRSKDPFGRTGDFVTSPEISQVFGELVGLWLVSQWIVQGRKSTGIDLIEVGPGRGTLMDDILRTLQHFKALSVSIRALHLVEASAVLRRQQKNVLCGTHATEEATNFGLKCPSKYNQLPVYWYEDIRSVPKHTGRTPFIIAHEFFDALPIQAFQSVPPSPEPAKALEGLHGPIKLQQSQPKTAQTPQWRELMVATSRAPSTLTTSSRPILNSQPTPHPEFELTLAKASTPSSLVLPETSERYRALKSKPGSVIEISSEANQHAVDFAERIGGASNVTKQQSKETPPIQPAGAALIIDYGTSDTIPTSTLRGIKSHKLVSPFSQPGEVDLSADVDFTALAEAAIDASEGVEVHGPIEQGEWLERMGIKERAEELSKKAPNNEQRAETVKKIQDSVKRLVERGGGGMGKLYKVMAIVPESGGRRPVGFGGEVDT